MSFASERLVQTPLRWPTWRSFNCLDATSRILSLSGSPLLYKHRRKWVEFLLLRCHILITKSNILFAQTADAH
ncbi:hypothetical protein L596_016450 [Steinernema carpocapsae]|uniref:Uncharacterized protein n=1 Tax=Steinernema carpocapsae TaxID=34508 RepID=A0A4U5NIZ5_STECR|nr:hypothetical protein L596_016450 [Steinernema carpocapsae]